MKNFIYPQFGDGGGGGGGASGPLPLASAGTWVAINGNGFANIPNATAVLFLADTATANYIPTDWTGPRVVVSDFTDFAGSVRIYARLAEISGDNGVYAWFGIVSEVNNYYRGIRIRADNGAVQTRLDGGAGTNPGVIPTDGTGWVAYDRTGGTSNWYFGTGTSTQPPSNWSWAYSVGDTAAPYNQVSMALSKQNPTVEGTATWADAYYERL